MNVLQGGHQQRVRLAGTGAAAVEGLKAIQVEERLLLGKWRVRAVQLSARFARPVQRAQADQVFVAEVR